MQNEKYCEAIEIINERYSCDNLISVATVKDNHPSVRIVNSYYEEGSFYIVTYALSNKMQEIMNNPKVAICAEWFTAHGIGENLGHVLNNENLEIMSRLRTVFSEWYYNGHTDENDKNTCVLRVRLVDGVLLNHGTRYNIDFINQTLK